MKKHFAMKPRARPVEMTLSALLAAGCFLLAGSLLWPSPAQAQSEPRGLWHFDNLTVGPPDTTSDSGPNGNTATVQGATWNQGKLNRFHSGFGFDGVADHLEVADTASLSVLSNLTVEAWIKVTAYTFYPSIVSKGNVGNYAESYALFLGNGTGHVGFLVNLDGTSSGRRIVFPSSATVPLDTWTHIAGTYDGTNVCVYVNGSPAGCTAYSASSSTIYDTADPLLIGKAHRTPSPYPDSFFNGHVDEVAVWGRAFSADEVSARAASGYTILSGPLAGSEGSDQIKHQDYAAAPIPDFAVFTSHFQSGSDVQVSIATADSSTIITGVIVEAARPKGKTATITSPVYSNGGKTASLSVSSPNGAVSARLRVTLTGGNTFAVNVDLP